jgi:hypothetical protein
VATGPCGWQRIRSDGTAAGVQVVRKSVTGRREAGSRSSRTVDAGDRSRGSQARLDCDGFADQVRSARCGSDPAMVRCPRPASSVSAGNAISSRARTDASEQLSSSAVGAEVSQPRVSPVMTSAKRPAFARRVIPLSWHVG